MKASNSFQMLFLGSLALAATSCQQEQQQQVKPIPKVTDVTSSTIQVQHDTATFNEVMHAPMAPDSVSNTKK